VDDSHAAGVAGATGKGSIEAAGMPRDRVLQTVTFSKAFGVYGGAVLGSRELIGSIPGKSHAIVGNTPLPLPLAAGVLASLKWVRAHPRLRLKLVENIELFWIHAVRPAPERLSPIVSFSTPNTKKLRQRLLARGVFPSHITYPGGPEAGYFRFAVSSAHSPKQIKALAEAVRDSDAESLR
jgi:7-keto-8-aminopelargonate synthetase-like enzyme